MLLTAGLAMPSWSTMSIVAVDPVTREVGGAGASCLQGSNGGVLIISDLKPGEWALHTQASWNATNQRNARQQMVAGKSPQAAMDWLAQNDIQSNPGIRQYGVAALFQDSSRSAAFTGPACGNYKGHLTGPTFAIQGNILKGPEVLDSMRARYTRTKGPLAEKLMAAMQGANMAGADSRCLEEGVSSQSAFLRVARPGDATGRYYLDLQVPSRPRGKEPIDSLQKLYDKWKGMVSVQAGMDAEGAGPALRISLIGGKVGLQSPGFAPGERISLSIHGLSGTRIFRRVATIRGDAVSIALPPALGRDACILTVETPRLRWSRLSPILQGP